MGPDKMEVDLKAPISGVVAEMLELRTWVHENALRNGINTGMQYAASRCWRLGKDLGASEEAREAMTVPKCVLGMEQHKTIQNSSSFTYEVHSGARQQIRNS